MIGSVLDRWPDDALRRVVDAPIERWYHIGMHRCARGWWDERDDIGDGRVRVCLYGFRAEHYQAWERALWAEIGVPGLNRRCPAGRYDHLVDRFGLPRVVRAIKIRARAILEERHPLEQRLVVLRAEVGA